MDILDKLFSRELNRRTGARAMKIDAEKQATTRKRQRMLGAEALKDSKKRAPRKESNYNLFQRINIRFPWLKLATVIVIGVVAVCDLLDLTISRTGDAYSRVRVAPMAKHVKATERVLFGKKLVALTFDDGPSSITTPRLLDILKEKDAVATFFVLGSMARNNPDIIKRAEKEGNEVASHTMYHQNLPRISAGAAVADINEAKGVISGILGHNVEFTRPPYGNVSDTVRTTVGTPIILWSVDTLDWQNRNPAMILENTKNQIYDGGIILMHDIYTTTVDAVSAVIDELRAAGYEFATLSEMAREKGIELSNGAVYRSFDL